MEKLLPVLVVFGITLGIVGIGVLAIRWTRKSSQRAALVGLGLQFFSSFVVPTPPPQIQLEELKGQARLKKDAEAGDPED
jgi:hypothetical protein